MQGEQTCNEASLSVERRAGIGVGSSRSRRGSGRRGLCSDSGRRCRGLRHRRERERRRSDGRRRRICLLSTLELLLLRQLLCCRLLARLLVRLPVGLLADSVAVSLGLAAIMRAEGRGTVEMRVRSDSANAWMASGCSLLSFTRRLIAASAVCSLRCTDPWHSSSCDFPSFAASAFGQSAFPHAPVSSLLSDARAASSASRRRLVAVLPSVLGARLSRLRNSRGFAAKIACDSLLAALLEASLR